MSHDRKNRGNESKRKKMIVQVMTRHPITDLQQSAIFHGMIM
jgi:hypothetical protein